MTQTILRESVQEAPTKKGDRWKVIVARPGKGSSGTYSEELFRSDAAKMIAPGGQSFITHDDHRNPKEMIGVYPEGAFWSEEDKAVVAELQPFSHWAAFVEEVGPHCGFSLYALGELDDEGPVTEFFEDVYNGADLVSRPGLVGSGLAGKLYESALAASATPSEKNLREGKETKEMDEKAIDAINALTTQVSLLVSANQTKAEEDAQIEADTKAIEEAVTTFATNVESIEAARESLLPSQVKHLMAEAKTGKDITALIESAKEVAAEAKTAVETDSGRVLTGATEGSKFGAWA